MEMVDDERTAGRLWSAIMNLDNTGRRFGLCWV